MKSYHNNKRNRRSLSLDELGLIYKHDIERTIYQKEIFSIFDIDKVWQRRGKSKEGLGEPVIKKLVNTNINSDENNKLQQIIKQKERQTIETDTTQSEEYIQNIIKFIENNLPSYSSSTQIIKGQNKFINVFSDEHNQIFWNPCTAHHEKEKLQEILMFFYKIYASNEIDLYISVFDNNDFYATLIKLLECLLNQEKNTKKKDTAAAVKKEEASQMTKSKQVLLANSKKKVTKILITDEASYNKLVGKEIKLFKFSLFPIVHYLQFAKVKYQYLDQSAQDQINQHVKLLSIFGFNIFPIDTLSNSIPQHHIVNLDKWKLRKWVKKYFLNKLNAELNQLEKEKQILKCRLCGSKIDVTEANQHSSICLKNSQTKKKILAMDQELVNLINDSLEMRQKYRKIMSLWIVKQNKQIKNSIQREDSGINIDDPSPVNNNNNNHNSTPSQTDKRKLRPMTSQTSQEGLGLDHDTQSNSSLQQIDEDSLSNSSQSRLGSDSVSRIKIDRKQKKRVSTQVISGDRIPSISGLPKQKQLEQNEQKMEQFRKYGEVLKELITYGEKVINANEQTLDIRNEIQLKQTLESLKGAFPEEDGAEINSLIERFDLHLKERIEITKKAQKYDQDLKHQSSLNNPNPDSPNPSMPNKKSQLQNISGSMKVKGYGLKFGSNAINPIKSSFNKQSSQSGSSDDNKESQSQEEQDSNHSSPKPSEEKKEEPKKRMTGIAGGLNKRLQEKNKGTGPNAISQFKQGNHSGSSEQVDQVLSTQSSMNVTTSASIDSLTSSQDYLPKSKSEDVHSTLTSSAPAQTNDPPKEEPKKSNKIMSSKLTGNLKARNLQRAEGISNSIDSPQNAASKVETAASPQITANQTSQKSQSEQAKNNTAQIETKPIETQKQTNNLTLITQQNDNGEQNQTVTRPKQSPKKKFLKRNASNILEEDEEFEDDDYCNSKSKKQEVIQEDEEENENVDTPTSQQNQSVDTPTSQYNQSVDTPTSQQNEKEQQLEVPGLGKQSSFGKAIIGSTPQNPRKLDTTTGTSSFEKLNNFKNLRQHNKKNGEGSPISSSETLEQKLENKQISAEKKPNEQIEQQNNQYKKNPSLEQLESDQILNGGIDSNVIYEENESHSSVHFSVSTIGKVSETNLPSDMQLSLINNINGNSGSPTQSQQSLSFSYNQSDQCIQNQSSTPFQQSPPKDFSKNKQIKQQLQNLEQITPNKIQQTCTDNDNKNQNKRQNQLTISEDVINNDKQEHLSTQEESPTDKANGVDKNLDNQPKSRFSKEQKSFKDDEESPEQNNSQKSFGYDNILAEDNLVLSSNFITAPSDSTSTKKKKKKSRNDLNNARLEDTENLISDNNDEDNDENDDEEDEEDDNTQSRKYKYFSSSSNSDESDGETSQMIASLLQESALGSGSDSDDSDKPAFIKIIKDKEQIKQELQKSRFSFITPLINSEDSEDQGYESKNTNLEQVQQVEEEQEKELQQENESNQVVTAKKYSNAPSVLTYYPDLPDFSKYNIITEKGFNSDSELVKLDTQKKKDQMSIGFKDFEFIKMLGKGAYGGVYLVKKKNNNDLFAMKVIDCSGKLDGNYLKTLQSEKNVFEVITGDWVVKAFYSFVHENYLCFVLEYMMGGDFIKILSLYTALDQWIVEIYLAELVLAIEYLHSMNIVHRDLKPDNMLIDQTGHLKLADFGLSEVGFQSKLNKHINKTGDEDPTQAAAGDLIGIELEKENDFKIEIQVEGMKNNEKENEQQQQQKRIVGTPDYIAPEIINGEATNNKTLDWWSMGIIMYEFLVGLPPFNADSIEEIFDNIKNQRMEWPEIGDIEDGDKISPEAHDLIKQLLNPNYKERLGAKGAQEIKAHPFFKNITWNKLRSTKPPIQPKSKHTEEAKEKREKDKQQMQQFLNSLNIKQGIKGKTDDVSKKLQESMKELERSDLVAQQNIEEANQMIEEKNTKKIELQKKIDKYKKAETKLMGQTYDFYPVKPLDDFQS